MAPALLHVALAALLHDIGKFWQRTGESPPGYESFTEEDCGPHGAHAKWSAAFVSEYIPSEWRGELSAVLYHHKPVDYLSRLVALADWLSAGERVEEESKGGSSRLRSVFDRVRLRDSDGKPIPTPGEEFYYPLAPLSLESDGQKWKLNPHAGDGWVTPEEYAAFWGRFTSEMEQLNSLDLCFANYVETFYHLLKKYTWCVPSACYKAVPDVSLFDHSRITAAIAVCLYQDEVGELVLRRLLDALGKWWEGGPQAKPPSELLDPRFLLVGGDISGVQDFIYTITSSGAAKGLRGRSLYLQLLSEAVARFLLRKVGLLFLNIIYLGGGTFYFLAPLSAREKLEELKWQVARRLIAVHKGDIYLALDAVEVCPLDFIVGRKLPSRWAEKMTELYDGLNRAKERRFAELGREMYSELFVPRGEGGPPEEEGKEEPKFCQVCQEEDWVREDEDGV
ncbi:MAG TPA: type III-A CRISPR-associated protein Cas10/Csm1, partial [Candidatus Latescibacteria bacterium]|nr:type III-A CRISPR-associated protein Cas10/Csm1 [Candidatus Latescibacterota bacterium]